MSILTGFDLTPQVAAFRGRQRGKKIPTVIQIPSTPALMKMSPYFLRVSNNMQSTVWPGADWVANNGKKRAYIAVSDYAPGHQVQAAFKRKFTELGGTIVGEDRIPLNTVDYAPFAERVARSDADVVQVFIPPGPAAVSFTRGLLAQGVRKKGTLIMGVGETDEAFLAATTIPLSASTRPSTIRVSSTTKKRTSSSSSSTRGEARRQRGSTDAFVVQGYNGMHAVRHLIENAKGQAVQRGRRDRGNEGLRLERPARRDEHRRRQPRYHREHVHPPGRAGERKLENVIVDTYRAVKPLFIE